MSNPNKFVTTDSLSKSGEAGEQLVWEIIQQSFAQRDCIGYWRYPIFSECQRKEPDILVADCELGLIVIEVKSITIDQIVNITGHRWEYQNFYLAFGSPYQQAENQLFALLKYSDREPSLCRQIPGRAMVALPLITQQQWQARGFHQLPSSPPILFKDDLQPSVLGKIKQSPPVIRGNPLTRQQWKLLLAILAGTPVYCQPSHRVLSPTQSRGKILQQVRSRLSELDWQQEHIGKEIPPGPQRIRGIAGSGKTVLLCQKAAHMHLKHPEWKLAFVFFSRSLYQPITEQIDRWLRYFSGDRQGYDPKNRNLRVLHAWGAKKQPGLYSLLCQLAGIKPLGVNATQSKKPNEALAEVCVHLLQSAAIPQIFDAILIDEGQDLIADCCKFAGKQPFYWLAYQALRPADPIHPEQKRLIWAYDEAQSLESLGIPTASELLGEELGHLVTGNYRGGINKSEIMSRCYRTPGPILTAAHGIGMGILRPGGMLSGITRPEEWQAIGYEVEGHFTPGDQITLKRPPENSPNPVPHLWQGSVIEFQAYSTRQQELTALANDLRCNLRHDGLRPSQEILVITLGHFYQAARLETDVADFLIKQGIDCFIPGTSECNLLQPERDRRNPNKFWCEGAVTVSRIHRAKGNEADMVYILGCDRVAQEDSIPLRNQLFVALTRARGWVKLSGIGSYPLYEEIYRVIQCGDTFTFTFRRPPQRELSATDAGELLHRYAVGGRNFQNVDLRDAQLAGIQLQNANLIGANLSGANLQNAQLSEAKLIAADIRYTNLTGAKLRKAKLIGAMMGEARLNRADLTNADLSSADLSNAQLVEATLVGANLNAANLSGANLTNAKLENAIL